MSNDTFYWGGDARQEVAANNATILFGWSGNSGDISYATEANGQFKNGLACTLDKGRVFLVSISASFIGIFGPRMAGVNGNVAVSCSATGETEDTTHTDSVSAGTLTIWRATGNKNGSSATSNGTLGVHVSGTTSETYTCQTQGSGTWNHSGTANAFVPMMGRIGGLDNGTEVNVQLKQRAAGAWSALRAVCTVNSIPATTTISYRKNATTGNQTVSFASSTTGIVDDTTHSDTLANADLVCVLYSSGSATGSMTMVSQCETFAPSAHQWDMLNYTTGQNTSNTVVTFVAPTGLPGPNTTESQFQARFRWASRVASLRGFWINNFSSSGSLVSRLNGVTGNCSVTPSSSGTGYFEDTTHNDAIASGDLFCWQQGIALSIGWREHIMATYGLAANNAAIGTIFGQFSQAIAASVKDIAAISTIFGLFSQAAAGTVLPTFRGPIAMTFGGISQVVVATDVGVRGTGIRRFWTF